MTSTATDTVRTHRNAATKRSRRRRRTAASANLRRHRNQDRLSTQHLAILLDGITAGDYLACVRDPEPQAQDRELRSLSTRADPLSDRIDLLLIWGSDPPPPRAAAIAAGFPPLPDIVVIEEVPQRSRRVGMPSP
jgi:hypothetical protein